MERARTDDAPSPWPPAMHALDEAQLRAFAPRQYRRVEVRRDDDGAPFVAWDGSPADDVRVSIAHAGGWAVAALATHAVGVDLEEVAPRPPGFNESYLSAAELRLVHDVPAAERDRVGTLLWVLKEACLKTGASAARTVWELGAIELGIDTPATELVAAWPTADGSAPARMAPARLAALETGVRLTRAPPDDARKPARADAAYGGTNGLVVGVVALHEH
jgi:hypothetical protein